MAWSPVCPAWPSPVQSATFLADGEEITVAVPEAAFDEVVARLADATSGRIKFLSDT